MKLNAEDLDNPLLRKGFLKYEAACLRAADNFDRAARSSYEEDQAALRRYNSAVAEAEAEYRAACGGLEGVRI